VLAVHLKARKPRKVVKAETFRRKGFTAEHGFQLAEKAARRVAHAVNALIAHCPKRLRNKPARVCEIEHFHLRLGYPLCKFAVIAQHVNGTQRHSKPARTGRLLPQYAEV